jgi:hypothetical protein
MTRVLESFGCELAGGDGVGDRLLLEARDLFTRREGLGGRLESRHRPPEQRLCERLVLQNPPAARFETGGQRVEAGFAPRHGLAKHREVL